MDTHPLLPPVVLLEQDTNQRYFQQENSTSLTLPASHWLSACPTDLSSPTAVPKGRENMAIDWWTQVLILQQNPPFLNWIEMYGKTGGG